MEDNCVCALSCVFTFTLLFSCGFSQMVKCNSPPVRFIISHLAHNFTSPAVSVQQYHSWPLMLSRQTWPSCLVIRSEDLHSAYQSAPSLLSKKRAETKAVNTETVGSGFSTGAGTAMCSIKRKSFKVPYAALVTQWQLCKALPPNMLICYFQKLVVFS